MITFIIAFAAGLIVGWNVFPQPAKIKKYYDEYFGNKEV
jgi:hypothetical protein